MFDPRFSRKVRLKIIFAKTPRWLRQTLNGIGFYYLVFFAVFVYRTFPNKASENDEILLLSVNAAAFYCAFAAILTSYAGSERPLRSDEI